MISDNLELIMTIFKSIVIDLKRYLSGRNQNSYGLNEKETKSLNQIKQELKELFQQKYFPLTFLSIEKTFHEKTDQFLEKQDIQQKISRFNNETNLFQFLIKQFKSQNVEEFAQKIIHQIYQTKWIFLRDNIHKFLQNEKQPSIIKQTSKLLLKLLYQAKAKLIRRQKNPSSGKNSLFINLDQNEAKIVEKFNKNQTTKLISYDQGIRSYVLSVNSQTLVSILDPVETNLIDNIIDRPVDLLKICQTNSSKGQNLSCLMRLIMTEKSSIFKYSSSFQKLETFYFKEDPKTFESIPKINDPKYQTYDFLQSFYQYIKESMTDSQDVPYFCKPVKKIEEEMYNQFSKTIDFVICEKITQQIKIYAYDVIVTNSLDEITDKVLTFLFNYSNFKENAFKYYQGPQISYPPIFYYNVIVSEKFEIDWKTVIQRKKASLIDQIEAKKKNLSVPKCGQSWENS